MPLPGLSADFNEPQSDDPTSAPPMPDQQRSAAVVCGTGSGISAGTRTQEEKGTGNSSPTLRTRGSDFQSEACAALIAEVRLVPKMEKPGCQSGPGIS